MRPLAFAALAFALLLAGCTGPAADTEATPALIPTSSSLAAPGGEAGTEAAFPCVRAFLGTSYESEATYDAIADAGAIVKPEGIRGPPLLPRDTRIVAVRITLDVPPEERGEPGFWSFVTGDETAGDPSPYVEARFAEGNWSLFSGGLRATGLANAHDDLVAFVVNVTGANESDARAAVDALAADADGAKAGPVAMPAVTTEALRALVGEELGPAYSFGGYVDGPADRYEEARHVDGLELRYREPLAVLKHAGPGAQYELTSNEQGEVTLVARFSDEVAPRGRDPDELIRLVASDLAPLELTHLDRRGILELSWGETACGSAKVTRNIRIDVGFEECAALASTSFQATGAYAALPPPISYSPPRGMPAPEALGAPDGVLLTHITNQTRDGSIAHVAGWSGGWTLEIYVSGVGPDEIRERVLAFLGVTTTASEDRLAETLAELDRRMDMGISGYAIISIEAPPPDPEALAALLATLGEGSPDAYGGTMNVEFQDTTGAGSSWRMTLEAPLRALESEVDGGELSLRASAFGDLDASLLQDEPLSIARDEAGLQDALRRELLALGLPGVDGPTLAAARIDVRCDGHY